MTKRTAESLPTFRHVVVIAIAIAIVIFVISVISRYAPAPSHSPTRQVNSTTNTHTVESRKQFSKPTPPPVLWAVVGYVAP